MSTEVEAAYGRVKLILPFIRSGNRQRRVFSILRSGKAETHTDLKDMLEEVNNRQSGSMNIVTEGDREMIKLIFPFARGGKLETYST